MMDEGLLELERAPRERERLVHAHIGPARAAAVIQAPETFAHHRPVPAHGCAHVPGFTLEEAPAASERRSLGQAPCELVEQRH